MPSDMRIIYIPLHSNCALLKSCCSPYRPAPFTVYSNSAAYFQHLDDVDIAESLTLALLSKITFM
jgi:hypothetical protein